MDLIARKKVRDEKKEQERLARIVREEVFRKQQTIYMPTSKKMTIITFIFLVIAIPLIYYTTDVAVKDACGLIQGIECMKLNVTRTHISFEVHNMLKDDNNITLTIDGCGSDNDYLRPNTKATFEFECRPMAEKIARKEIKMTYVGYTGLSHDEVGQLIAKVQQ